MLGFFDLSTFFSASVLILWGLVLPILRPISSPDFQLYLFDQKSLAMGLYTGLILCSLVVIFRVALQFLIVRSSDKMMVIPTPPKPIFVNQAEVKEKTTIEDSLSSIRSEIALLREEISSLSVGRVWSPKSSVAPIIEPEDSSGWAIGDANPIFSFSASHLGVSRDPQPPIQHPTGTEDLISNAGIQNSVPIPQEYEPTTGRIQLPDSAKDNPWAFVLSGRQARSSPPITPRNSPMDSQATLAESQITPVEPLDAGVQSQTDIEPLVPKVELQEVALAESQTMPQVMATAPDLSQVEPQVTISEEPEVALGDALVMAESQVSAEPQAKSQVDLQITIAEPQVVPPREPKVSPEDQITPTEMEATHAESPVPKVTSEITASVPQVTEVAPQVSTVESPKPVEEKKSTPARKPRRRATRTKKTKLSTPIISEDEK